MPTSTHTPGSGLNPSQKDSDEKFNDIAQNSPEYPDVEKGLSDLENFSRENAADVDKSIAEKEQEPSGNWKDNTTGTNKSEPSLKDRAVKILKKRGGIIGLIGAVGIGGILAASFLAPSSLLINLMENLSSTNDTSSTAMERRFMKIFGFSTSESDPICANSSKNIRCKMGRISNKALNQLSKKGVVAYFDDGVTNTNSKTGYPSRNPKGYTITVDGVERNIASPDLPGFLSNNPRYAARVLGAGGAFNLKVKAWSGKYISQKLYKLIPGFNRSGGLADGDINSRTGNGARNALTKLRSKIPGLDKLSNITDSIKTKVSEQTGKAKKGGVGYMIAVAGCVGVKAPGYIAAGVAAVQLAQIISIAHDTILSPGSKLKAAGADEATTITAEEVGDIGSLLTETTPRASDGAMTSALDSPILLAALGINTNKAPVAKDIVPGYSMFSNGFIGTASEVEENTEAACNAIMSPAAMWTAFAIDSAVTVAASTTIVGGIAKVVASWVVGEIISAVATEVVGGIATNTITELAENDVVTQAQGEQLGDVIGVSALAFFSAGGMARGLPVLKKSQLTDYAAVQQENEEFQRQMDIATLSPFDTSSQYTFLGSIVHNTQLAVALNSSQSFSPMSILSTFSNALSGIFPNASAATTQTVNSCGYAEEFFLDTIDPDETPAINAAGLPCTGITSEQASMSTETALSLIENEGWFDESKSISDNSTIEDLLQSGYIKADTPLSDFIISCGNALSGDYLINSAGCTTSGTTKSTDELTQKTYNACTEGGEDTTGSCISDSYDGGEATIGLKDPRSLTAISVFLLDFQINQSINGEDEATGSGNSTTASTTVDLDTLFDDGTSVGCAEGTDEVRNDTGYNNGVAIPIKLCSLPNTYELDPAKNGREGLVNSRASGAVYAMFEKMRTDLKLNRIALNDSFRTYDEQVRAKAKYGAQAADPGYSNHQMGIAFDVEMGDSNGGNSYSYVKGVNTSYPDNPVWEWLNTNAINYGFKQYSPEGWHWSATGG